MTDFEFRKKTFQTPKPVKKKKDSDDVNDNDGDKYKKGGAVSLSEFNQLKHRRRLSTKDENYDVDFQYGAPKRHKKNLEENETSSTDLTSTNQTIDISEEKEQTKAPTTPTKTQRRIESPVKAPVEEPETIVIHDDDDEQQQNDAETHVEEDSTESSEKKIRLVIKRGQRMTNLQRFVRPILLDEMQKVNDEFTGTTSFVADGLIQCCKSFFGDMLNIQDIPPLHKPRVRVNTQKATQLIQKEKALRVLLKRFTEESNQWKQLRREYSSQPVSLTQRKNVPEGEIIAEQQQQEDLPESTFQPLLDSSSISEQLVQTSLWLGDINNRTREAETQLNEIEDYCSLAVTKIYEDNFKNHETSNPEKLISSIAFESDENGEPLPPPLTEEHPPPLPSQKEDACCTM